MVYKFHADELAGGLYKRSRDWRLVPRSMCPCSTTISGSQSMPSTARAATATLHTGAPPSGILDANVQRATNDMFNELLYSYNKMSMPQEENDAPPAEMTYNINELTLPPPLVPFTAHPPPLTLSPHPSPFTLTLIPTQVARGL